MVFYMMTYFFCGVASFILQTQLFYWMVFSELWLRNHFLTISWKSMENVVKIWETPLLDIANTGRNARKQELGKPMEKR